MHRKLFLNVALTALASSLLPALAWAQVKFAGLVFPSEVILNNQKLALNGYGIRFRFGLRAYAAALYTPTKISKNEEALDPKAAKRLHMIAMRDLNGEDFGKVFARNFEQNMKKEDFSKIVGGVLRLGNIFSEAKQLVKGESIFFDLVPSVGLTITVRGKPQGEPFKEPEFAENFFRLWFGKNPPDDQLRKALLGEETTANTNIY
jgi:hypothetical protein